MEEIYRIVDRETDKEIGVYMQPTARDEYNFRSVKSARESNCHGIYKDKAKYKIRKYKLVLMDDDCDPASEEDFARLEREREATIKRFELMNEVTKELYGNVEAAELALHDVTRILSEVTRRELEEILG